ncbi:MAG: antitoxin, partial [Nocardioides sp.]
MGLLDKMKAQAKKTADQHGDKIAKGIDKAATTADNKTKGKYSKHIGTGRSKAKEALDKLDDKRDDKR